MAKSDKQWLRRHVTDPYVRKAKEQGYRSRAAFKLIEIDQREKLLRRAAVVVDLGAAPGGWSQVAAAKVGAGGRVIAIDLLKISPIQGVTIFQADFRDASLREALAAASPSGRADLVLSDLAPNLSGIPGVDQARALEMTIDTIGISQQTLKAEGALLVKVFHGEAFDEILKAMKRAFGQVKVVKPAASRGESAETYVLGRGLLCSAKSA